METGVEDYLDSMVFTDHPCTYQHQVQNKLDSSSTFTSKGFEEKQSIPSTNSKLLFLEVFPIKVQKI